MDDLIRIAQENYRKVMAEHKPHATVAMISGALCVTSYGSCTEY